MEGNQDSSLAMSQMGTAAEEATAGGSGPVKEDETTGVQEMLLALHNAKM